MGQLTVETITTDSWLESDQSLKKESECSVLADRL